MGGDHIEAARGIPAGDDSSDVIADAKYFGTRTRILTGSLYLYLSRLPVYLPVTHSSACDTMIDPP